MGRNGLDCSTADGADHFGDWPWVAVEKAGEHRPGHLGAVGGQGFARGAKKQAQSALKAVTLIGRGHPAHQACHQSLGMWHDVEHTGGFELC